MSIAVLGGSFDPVHLGHLKMLTVPELEGLKLIMLPNGLPPHKQSTAAAASHRLKMCQLAITDSGIRAEIDTREIVGLRKNSDSILTDCAEVVSAAQNGGFWRGERIKTYVTPAENPTLCGDQALYAQSAQYTYLSLQSLKADYGDIVFVVGSDSFLEIFSWKNPAEIARLAEILIIPRPNYTEGLDVVLEKWMGIGGRAKISALTAPDISSTEVRVANAFGAAGEYIGKSVLEYINKSQLYEEYKELAERVKGYGITEERFLHTGGVAMTAAKLAKFYGADVDKAVTAAILHDVAKEAVKNRADFMYLPMSVRHAAHGAEIARDEFGISDSEILDAIRYHTTGRPGMGLLEKIIYLADAIEPARGCGTVDKVRELAYTDLNAAVRFAIKNTINHLNERQRPIYPLTIDAYNYYTNLLLK